MNTSGLYILYGVLAVGAAGLYGLLPGVSRGARRPAAVVLAAACAGLIVFGARAAGFAGPRDFYFAGFAALALFGAVRVVTHTRPVYSALYFIVVVLAVAGLMVLADAEFLAAAILIIYAGAILVTYIFVIMLAQQGTATECDVVAREPLAAVLAAFLLVACVSSLLGEEPAALARGTTGGIAPAAAAATGAPAAGEGNVRLVGAALLTRYAVAVEVGGVLLLVAMVGAIWLARRPVPPLPGEPAGIEARAPGRIGREVPPF